MPDSYLSAMKKYEEIQNRLHQVEDDLHRIINSERRLAIIQQELELIAQDLENQKKRMRQEHIDLLELEQLSVRQLFNKVLGNVEEQLEKERQEYLQEVLTYNSLIDELNLLRYEEDILKPKISRKLEVQKTYEVLLKEKERFIKLNHPKIAKDLQIIDAQIEIQQLLINEVKEGEESGKDLLKHLDHMVHLLKYVKQWGRYRLRGRGKYSSVQKKEYIDKAQKLVGVIQVKFNLFEKELRDLYPDFDLNIDNYHIKAFVENFYDGLITDWIITKKLQTALHSTIDAIQKVHRLMAMLSNEESKINETLGKKIKERTTYLSEVDLS